jgi:cation diffusion facilitator family transporter
VGHDLLVGSVWCRPSAGSTYRSLRSLSIPESTVTRNGVTVGVTASVATGITLSIARGTMPRHRSPATAAGLRRARPRKHRDMEDTRSQLRYTEGRRIVVAGVVVNICLTFVKVLGGIVGHSQALVADGVHSLSDLVTDLVVFFGLRYSSQPRDANHPYGHGKIETLASVLVGVLLVITGVLIGYDAVRAGLDRVAASPKWIALAAAVASIVFKEALYHYTLRYARRLGSNALVANAWHHRSDALSSLAALGGVIGARLGYPILDPIAAVLVSVMIVKVGIDVMIKASRELVEETLHDEETARMVERALQVSGVMRVPEIQSRYVGPAIVVDMSITVHGGLTVAEGHDIAHRVERALISAFPDILVVTVHVEPHEGLPPDHQEPGELSDAAPPRPPTNPPAP